MTSNTNSPISSTTLKAMVLRNSHQVSIWIHEYLSRLLRSPFLEAWIKFTATTTGRDKIYRTIQYWGRFIVWYFERKLRMTRGPSGRRETIERIRRLTEACGHGRKLFRFGRSIDCVREAVKAYMTMPDRVIQWGMMGKNLFYGAWLVLDSIQWLTLIGVIRVRSLPKLNRIASFLWLFGLMCSLTIDIYKLDRLAREHVQQLAKTPISRPIDSSSAGKYDKSITPKSTEMDQQMINVLLDFTRDFLDIFIPGSALNYVKLEPGVVGLLGTASSLIGVYQAWPAISTASSISTTSSSQSG